MEVIYSGVHAEVEVPNVGIVAVRDEPVNVPDQIAKRLVEQDCWNKPETDAQRKAREAAEQAKAEQDAAAEKAAAEARAKVAAEQAERDKGGK